MLGRIIIESKIKADKLYGEIKLFRMAYAELKLKTRTRTNLNVHRFMFI